MGLKTENTRQIFLILALSGLLVWIGISWVSGKKEAWHAPFFNTIGIPLLALISGIAGFLYPKNWDLWEISIISLQPIALYLTSGIGKFFIVGLLFFGFYAFVCTVGSLIGVGFRKAFNYLVHKVKL